MNIPVAPGRNIATLIEVACKVAILRRRGYYGLARPVRQARPGPGRREAGVKDGRFLIITGLSGSGKTVVSRFLEDLGYYCIDNLPVKLIPMLVQLWRRRELAIDRVALVVDIRERGFLTAFPKVWAEIRRTEVGPADLPGGLRRHPGQAVQREPAAPSPGRPPLGPGRASGWSAAGWPGSRPWPTRSSTPRGPRSPSSRRP